MIALVLDKTVFGDRDTERFWKADGIGFAVGKGVARDRNIVVKKSIGGMCADRIHGMCAVSFGDRKSVV